MGFLGTLISGYKIMGQETGNYICNNKAQIASGISIVGTVVSNVLSTKAGAKSARSIDAKAYELGRPLTTKEKVELCWQNHIVPGAVAAGSCVSAVYSNNQHVKNFNKAATAYGALKRVYDSTQKATREVLGEKKSQEVQDKVNQKQLENNPKEKQKLLNAGENPQPGVMLKYWEPVSGEVFYSTRDRIDLAVRAMNAEMEALKPREPRSQFYHCGEYGVKLHRLFELLDIELPNAKDTSEVMTHYGWNKGKELNGSDDEKIDYFFSPMTLDEETGETCSVINWDTRPSDMRYGDYMKV